MKWPESEQLKIQPGDKVRDSTSNWVGTAVCEYRYMNGCLRYELAGADNDGKPIAYIFDEETLEVLERAATDVPQPRRTGGARSSTPVPRR